MRHEQADPADEAAHRDDGPRYQRRARYHREAQAAQVHAERYGLVVGERSGVEPPAREPDYQNAQDYRGRAEREAFARRARQAAHEPEGYRRKHVLRVGGEFYERDERREERAHNHAGQYHHDDGRRAAHAADCEDERDGGEPRCEGRELDEGGGKAREYAERRAERRARRYAERVRRRERIREKRLEGRARDGEPRAREHRERDARQPYVEQDAARKIRVLNFAEERRKERRERLARRNRKTAEAERGEGRKHERRGAEQNQRGAPVQRPAPPLCGAAKISRARSSLTSRPKISL